MPGQEDLSSKLQHSIKVPVNKSYCFVEKVRAAIRVLPTVVGDDTFFGGTMALDGDRAHTAIREHVAGPLGLSVHGRARPALCADRP